MSFQSGESPIARALRNAGQIIGGYMQQERQRRLQEELQRGQLSQERAKLLVDDLREQLAKQYALPPGQQDRRTIANLEREIQQLGGVLDSPARDAAPVFQSATQGFDQATRGRRTTADREAPARRQDVEAGTGRVAEARDVTLPGLQGRAREQPTQAVIGQAAGESARAQRVFESEQAQAEALQSQVTRIQNEVIPDQIERLEESISPDLTREERQQVQAQIGTLENMLLEQPSGVQGAQDFLNRAQRMGSPTALASEARATGAGRAETGEAQVANATAILDTATSYQDTILDLSGEVEDDELAGELRRRANAIGQLPRTVATPEGATEFMNQWNALEGERPTAALLVEAQQQAARDATASERDQGTLDIMEDFATREGLTAEEKLNQIAAAASAMPEGFLERNRERVAQIEGLANLEDPQALRQRTLEQRQQQLQNRLSKLDVEEAERTLDEVVEQEKLQTIRDRIDTEIASGTRDAEIRTTVAEMISAEAGAKVDDATIDALITQRRLNATESQLDVDFKEATFDDRVTRVGQDVAEGKISIEDGLAELYRDEVRFKQNTQLRDAELTRANQAIRDANIELERGQEDEVRNRVISAAETGFTGDLNDDEMAALAHYLGHEPGSQEFTAEISEIRQSNLDAIEASREREELLNDELIQSIGISEDRARREAERFRWETYDRNQTLSDEALQDVTQFEDELLNAVQGGNPGLFNNLLTAMDNPEAYPQLSQALRDRGFVGTRGKNRLKTLRSQAQSQRERTRETEDLELRQLETQVRRGVLGSVNDQFSMVNTMAGMIEEPGDVDRMLSQLDPRARALLEDQGLDGILRGKVAYRNSMEDADEALQTLDRLTTNRPGDVEAWRETFLENAGDAGFTDAEARSMADGWESVWQREGNELQREINEHDLRMQLLRKDLDEKNLELQDLRDPDSPDALTANQRFTQQRNALEGLRRTIQSQMTEKLCVPAGTFEGMAAQAYARAGEGEQMDLRSDTDECIRLSSQLENVNARQSQLTEMLNVGVESGPTTPAPQGGNGVAQGGNGGEAPQGGQLDLADDSVNSLASSYEVPPGDVNLTVDLLNDERYTQDEVASALVNQIGLFNSTEEANDFIRAIRGNSRVLR